MCRYFIAVTVDSQGSVLLDNVKIADVESVRNYIFSEHELALSLRGHERLAFDDKKIYSTKDQEQSMIG